MEQLVFLVTIPVSNVKVLEIQIVKNVYQVIIYKIKPAKIAIPLVKHAFHSQIANLVKMDTI